MRIRSPHSGVTEIGDSKNPDGPTLTVPNPDWDAFLDQVAAGVTEYSGRLLPPSSRGRLHPPRHSGVSDAGLHTSRVGGFPLRRERRGATPTIPCSISLAFPEHCRFRHREAGVLVGKIA
ncbi:DUF397 domain-containing protein [Spinactinospora alkalitolerans]|uniref:DUF397 domain-containing protein n=1 Tax=Spinactinospora alkalitolerans TaxID=687207 RepID=UPI0028A94848|nr:DUF397 domain-containing protein [Spinactinospora alkalitolerans]